MITIETIRFPFLGSLIDGDPFQYLLHSLSNDRAEIGIYDWFVNRTHLNVGEQVDLFIPTSMSEEFDLRGNISGTVISAQPDEDMQAYNYTIKFNQAFEESDPNSVNLETFRHKLVHQADSPRELILHFLKDSMLLKYGVQIYIKHLGPYFSRITDYSLDDYSTMKALLFEDITRRIKTNTEKLREIYETLQINLKNVEDLPLYLNLEDLRDATESEIHLTLFTVAFYEDSNITDKPQFLRLVNIHNSPALAYINSIKALEKRLYSNYNNLVILYLNVL